MIMLQTVVQNAGATQFHKDIRTLDLNGQISMAIGLRARKGVVIPISPNI